ncbi:MAG: type II toxin-antitoxin system YhaV family toxin [Burkholderiales bacterium]|nr:type II toxin-antitoxin system YhaV family toxin [Burkholderiales bacterium]
MQRHGWNLLFHDCLIEQLRKLHTAVERAQAQDPQGFESNANVKLFKALSQLMLETVPGDPNREEYRQGNTMGPTFRHWRRAKIGRRFRLFFRFDSKTGIIIFAWVNDENTLRRPASADFSGAAHLPKCTGMRREPKAVSKWPKRPAMAAPQCWQCPVSSRP